MASAHAAEARLHPPARYQRMMLETGENPFPHVFASRERRQKIQIRAAQTFRSVPQQTIVCTHESPKRERGIVAPQPR